MVDPVVSIDEQIEEIDRELRIREKVYPRWVDAPNPKLTRKGAARHLARMRAVRDSLLELKALKASA